MKNCRSLLVILALVCTTSCSDNRKELEALRKQQDETNRRLEEIQLNDRIEREGKIQRNIESYLR